MNGRQLSKIKERLFAAVLFSFLGAAKLISARNFINLTFIP